MKTKIPLLTEVFLNGFYGPGFGKNPNLPTGFSAFQWKGRKLDEADIDFDKFTRTGAPSGRKPSKAPPDQGEWTPHDPSEYIGKAKPSGKKATFTELVPQPREGMGAMSMDTAKKLGLKKTPNWFLNPEHWEKGNGGDDELDWEPNLSLKPKTPEAEKIVSQVHQSGVRPQHVLKKDVWDKHFKKEFGGQGE